MSIITSGQSFQRMAIAKGAYRLSAKGSSRVTAYCLDFSRRSPAKGMDYANVLSGGSQAVVEMANAVGEITKMSLDDAIRQGHIAIKGTSPLDGRGKEFLEAIVKDAEMAGESAGELRSIYDNWDKFSRTQRQEIESRLAQSMGLPEENHTAMRFVNNTDYDIEIKLESHLQMGAGQERKAVQGIDRLALSSDPDQQNGPQKIVWAARESENLEKLKRLGFYEGDTRVTADNLDKGKAIYKDFQKRYGLRSSGEKFGVFDEITESRVDRELQKLGSQLEEVGFEGDLDQAIRSYQQYRRESVDGYFSPQLLHALEEDIAKGVYVSRGGKIHRTKIISGPKGDEKMFVLKPNLYIKFNNKHRIDAIQQKLNSRNYLQEEIEVISLVNDNATNRVLKEKFPDNHMTFDIPSMKGLLRKLQQNKRKSVVVMGHLEGDRFVTDLGNGKTFEVSLKDLKRLGRELDVNIFPMGCNSGAYGTGMGNQFNSIDALNRLQPAVQNNSSILGMLKDLAGNDLKVVIDEIPFQDRGYLQAKIQRENNELGVTTLVGTGVAGLIVFHSGEEEEENRLTNDKK